MKPRKPGGTVAEEKVSLSANPTSDNSFAGHDAKAPAAEVDMFVEADLIRQPLCSGRRRRQRAADKDDGCGSRRVNESWHGISPMVPLGSLPLRRRQGDVRRRA
jgi:hypothetical protein